MKPIGLNNLSAHVLPPRSPASLELYIQPRTISCPWLLHTNKSWTNRSWKRHNYCLQLINDQTVMGCTTVWDSHPGKINLWSLFTSTDSLECLSHAPICTHSYPGGRDYHARCYLLIRGSNHLNVHSHTDGSRVSGHTRERGSGIEQTSSGCSAFWATVEKDISSSWYYIIPAMNIKVAEVLDKLVCTEGTTKILWA